VQHWEHQHWEEQYVLWVQHQGAMHWEQQQLWVKHRVPCITYAVYHICSGKHVQCQAQ
jgi:hypothetical protein